MSLGKVLIFVKSKSKSVFMSHLKVCTVPPSTK
jgi:hypothetical protein